MRLYQSEEEEEEEEEQQQQQQRHKSDFENIIQDVHKFNHFQDVAQRPALCIIYVLFILLVTVI